MAKKCNKGWIVGIVVVILIILLLLYSRKAPEEAPEELPPAEEVTPPAEAPVMPPAEAEAPAEEPAAEPTAPVVKPSEVEVTQETTSMGVQGQETITEESWFSGISCDRNANKEAGTRYDDLMTFQFTNKNTKPYHLGYVKVMEQQEKNALRLSINGHGLRAEAVEACGTEVVQPGETIECTVTADLREAEEMVMGYGEKQHNILQADSGTMTTRTYFKC